jgi:hypothetical protein
VTDFNLIHGCTVRPAMVTKMKTLPKLWKLLSIAVLVIGINGETPGRESAIWLPERYNCLAILELERLKIDLEHMTVYDDDIRLAADFRQLSGWLQGFFSAWNINPASDGNVTKGANSYQVIIWIFSYCRAHPSNNVVDAVFEFMKAVSKQSATKD